MLDFQGSLHTSPNLYPFIFALLFPFFNPTITDTCGSKYYFSHGIGNYDYNHDLAIFLPTFLCATRDYIGINHLSN